MSESSVKQFLIFKISDRLYAAELADVLRVVSVGTIFRVPLPKENFDGVMRFEGKVIPVFNLRKAMGLGSKVYNSDDLVSVERVNDEEVGIVIESVEKVALLDIDYFNDVESDSPFLKKQLLWEGKEIYLLDVKEMIMAN